MRFHALTVAVAACLHGCTSVPLATAEAPTTAARGVLPIRSVSSLQAPASAGVLPIIATSGAGGQLPISKAGSADITPPLSTLIVKASAGTALASTAIPIQAGWTMTAGHTVGHELQAWGEKAGWKVIWNMPKDWAVPANSTFKGDFKTAATEVIKTLTANGALLRAQFYDGNKTLVIVSPGVTPQ